jgi:hypothetical protein
MNTPNNNLAPPHRLTDDPESRLSAAIEHKPDVQIPMDFASKVAARAVAQPLRRHRYAARFGRGIALCSVPLAAMALFALAPHASPNLKSLSFDAEVVLLVELALIGWWVARITPQISH